LVAFRAANQEKFPGKHNAPVPSFGTMDARLLIVGLAPGLKGANFTGRPFTGDYAGDLLYETLLKFGLARGSYDKRADDGLALIDTRITNAVRCVPPENKPTTEENNNCRPFLIEEMQAMPNLRVILSLGLVSHNAVLKTLGHKISAFKFGHGARHELIMDECLNFGSSQGKQDKPRVSAQVLRAHGEAQLNDAREQKIITLVDSYHCSRYNTQTKRLTTDMFHDVFRDIQTFMNT